MMSLARFTSTGDLKPVGGWARPNAYETWLAMLPRDEYDHIVRDMNDRINRMDVVRAQYVVCKTGDEWYEAYEPAYYAMGESRELAGKFIGLILWDVMLQRLEEWAFHKIDKTIIDENNLMEDIQVIEYFRTHDFPRPGRWRDKQLEGP